MGRRSKERSDQDLYYTSKNKTAPTACMRLCKHLRRFHRQKSSQRSTRTNNTSEQNSIDLGLFNMGIIQFKYNAHWKKRHCIPISLIHHTYDRRWPCPTLTYQLKNGLVGSTHNQSVAGKVATLISHTTTVLDRNQRAARNKQHALGDMHQAYGPRR